ncbi:MAG: acetyltransferase [Rhodospirillales bacterium]|nr:acetyltransferase [Rhodospirillales bacterium]
MSDQNKTGCLILGAGGHGKVVFDALRADDAWPRIAFVDADPHRIGAQILGATVLGDDRFLSEARKRGFSHFVVGVGSGGDNRPRRNLFEKGLEAGLKPATIRHASATRAPSARVGEGSVLLAGAILNPDCAIGRNVIVNTGAIVEHDCRIGDHAMIAPGAVVLGRARIGAGAFVGAGAVIRQDIPVGDYAVIGAGAVVLDPVPDNQRVAGVPARAMKPAG